MNEKQFLEFYEKQNKGLDMFDDEYIYVEIEEPYSWSNDKVDFFLEFTKVFPKGWDSYIVVDHHIGFINNTCTTYVWKEFLDTCIKYKLQWNSATKLYDENLDTNTLITDWNYESYEETYKKSLQNKKK